MKLASSTLDATAAFTAEILRLLRSEPMGKDLHARASAILLANPRYLADCRELAAPLPSDGTPYSRKIIYSGPLGEAMVAHWVEGAECLAHDHGEAMGIVTVLEGEFYEQSFLLADSLRALGKAKRIQEGDFMPVDARDIHSLKAAREGTTLHFYAPPIRRMKVYDQNSRTIYTVSDSCGAWIPDDESLILAREAFGADPLHHEVS